MDSIFNVFLTLHILGGAIGLFTGTINLARRKGGRQHRKIGLVFVYAMVLAGASALVLSIIHPNNFLFMVGVFTLYMTITGKRYMQPRMASRAQPLGYIDWLISIAMLSAGIWFIYLGALALIKSNLFGSVFLTFGFIGIFFVWQDWKNFTGKSHIKNFGLVAHIGRMSGAYIAALTAFLVVNMDKLPVEIPAFVVWLLPTLIITPLIIKWSRRYAVKKTNPRE